MFGIPFSFAFLSPVLEFLKAIPAKVWLYIFLALLPPALYLYGHHRGKIEERVNQQQKYEEAAKKERAAEQKQKDEDARKALQEQAELKQKLSQLELSKDELKKQLNELSKNKPTVDTCPKLPVERVRKLQADIDKANQ